MDLRPAPSLALLDAADVALTTGIIAGMVELAAGADAKAPEWIKVTPRGRVTTRDGRPFDFDPAVLAARFAADGIDIPVDTDHSTVLLGGQGRAPSTVGYASAVEARDDGTYARVDWNDAGRAALRARTHRYVSPTIHTDANGRATWLHSVALVSAPALSMPAVLHSTQGSPMKEIAKALGLAETATEADCLAALRGRAELKPLAAALGLPDTADVAALLQAATTLKAGAGDKGLVATLQAELATTNGRLAAVVKAARDRDVSELLGAALKDLKILPTDVDHFTKLCATDEGLATVRSMLSTRVPLLQPSGLDSRTAPSGDPSQDPGALVARARKIEAEMLAAGTPIMWSDAVTRAQREKA